MDPKKPSHNSENSRSQDKVSAARPAEESEVGSKELRRVGLKVTSPRLKIMHCIEEAANSGQRHLRAEDVYQKLYKEGFEIGLATVYRVLSQFESAGLLRRLRVYEHTMFELASESHHDHMICLETDEIIEFFNEDMELLQQQIAKEKGYELIDHSMILFVRPLDKNT